ncbi:MAG: hypothetical protein ACWGQW_20565, partial [bacterium]
MRILNRQLKFPVHSGTVGIAMYLLLVIFAFPLAMAEESGEIKARKVIQAAIEAMGGDAYLSVNATHSYGRYFQFSKGRKSFAQYNDWTVLKPVKWRFQLGKGKNQFVSIYNLEEGKGWTLEGKDIVEEIPEDDIEKFRRSAKEDLDIILRFRLDEEGMNFFYYGPNDIAGQGKHEAVEFLDMMNKSIVVFFDRQSHLPAKLEKHFTDSVGVRRKEEME